MAVIKKYEVKTSSGEVETYDLGAEAANVTMTDGVDLQTAVAALQAAGCTVDSSLSSSSTNPVANSAIYAALAAKAEAVQITSGDLNDVITLGFYYANSANTCNNLPASNLAFGMVVVRTTSANTNTCVQTLYAASSNIVYRRWGYKGEWGDWSELTVDNALSDTSEHPVQNKAVYAALEDKAVIQALNKEDLDEVTTPGFYYTNSANSCTNVPAENMAFGMVVVRTTSANTTTGMQTVYTASPNVVYRRWGYKGSWGSWTVLKFTDTTYSEATSTSAGLMSASDKAAVDAVGKRAMIYTGVCDTAQSQTAKEVTIDGFELTDMAIVIVRFTYGLAAETAVTLNVSDTGEMSMCVNGTDDFRSLGAALSDEPILMFMYNASKSIWQLMPGYVSNAEVAYSTIM